MMPLYDITAPLYTNMPVYPGDPPVIIDPYFAIAEGDICNVSTLSFGSHSGTHADMPRHFFQDGADCVAIPLNHFFGPAHLFQLMPPLKEGQKISAAAIAALDFGVGAIVLLHTGCAKYTPSPISSEAAALLVQRGVKTLGVDGASVDPHDDENSPAHKILLGSGVVILEGLMLDGVPPGRFTLSALPLKIKNGDGSPVRAVLMG